MSWKSRLARKRAIDEHYRRERDKTYKTTPGHARNVIGVAIGPRISRTPRPPEQCVRFYVEKKIEPPGAVDRPFLIPEEIEGMPTDVIPAGRFISFDPGAAPGAVIGIDYNAPNVDSALAGTLSAIVRLGGIPFVLGSNHVMAVNGRVPLGTRILFKPPEKFIVDPNDYVFARLTAYVPLRPEGPGYNPNEPNTVDCALAVVEKPDLVTGEFPRRIVDCDNPVEPVAGMTVETDDAKGTIEQVGARVRIAYRFGTFDFEDMVLIVGDNHKPFAKPGDSGTVVVDTARKSPTAIIVGGSQNYTIACRFSTAGEALKQELGEKLPSKNGGKLSLLLDRIPDDTRTLAADTKSFLARIIGEVKAKI